MIAAFVALSFSSCQTEIVNDTPDGIVKMRIHAASSAVDTKTVVSENQEGYYDINWSAGDQISVLEFVGNDLTQEIPSAALSEGASEAIFDVELQVTEGASFLYETVYPAEAFSTSSGENVFYRLRIPENQEYSASSFDGDADVMISRPVLESEQPEELSLEYKRIGAAARMVLKGITAGETITKVVFSTDEGKIAGYSKFDPTTAEFLGTYSASKNSIELTPASETTATGADVVWFRLYAITLSESFKVVVTTDAATYTKDVNLATANRELAFNDGGLTKFNVAFAAENRKANSTVQYVLVTDASSLSSGDVIRLGCAAKNKAAGAMNANSYFASVDATFNNGVLTSNNAIDIVLGKSGEDWTLTTSEGQITTSAAKAFKLNSGEQTTWTISISDGVATITGGSYGSIQYNVSSPRFLNYTSAQTSIEIYKKSGGVTPPVTKTLESISVSGQKTSFNVGDTFSFGGTVTANYSDNTSADVTSSATFSGNDMSAAGEQTVTVSYTEGGVTKNTTYSIVVNPGQGNNTCLDMTTKKYGNSAYNSTLAYGDWTIVNGANNNKGWAYFKMGGKNTTISSSNPCYIYNTKAISHSVKKITVHLPAGSLSKSGMSVKSWGVYVYSDMNMTTQVDYVAGGTITNSEGSFDFTPSAGKTWNASFYYKISWDLANTSTTNGIVFVDKITLYENN